MSKNRVSLSDLEPNERSILTYVVKQPGVTDAWFELDDSEGLMLYIEETHDISDLEFIRVSSEVINDGDAHV